jgi:hypothetical protein
MTVEGYDFGSERFEELLLRRFYPEKTDHESRLLLEYLHEHVRDFDRVSFSVRIGEGQKADPSMLPGVQRQAERNSKRRIDFVGWNGRRATLVELKTRLGHEVMGQLLSDALLWRAEYPDDEPPRLVAVGRTGTAEEIAVLNAHGIDAILYEEADAR